MKKITLMLLLAASMFSCGNNHKEELIYDLRMKIVATQPSTDWRSGKYSGVSVGWMLRSMKDTTMFCSVTSRDFKLSDSMFYAHKIGDIVHFDYIRKDRFYRILK